MRRPATTSLSPRCLGHAALQGLRRIPRRALILFVLAALTALDVALVRWWWTRRLEARVDLLIGEASLRYGVDRALVKAVIWRESRFRPAARGQAGELGLMQVGALAGQEWARSEGLTSFQHADLLDPRRNVLAGTWYLAHVLKRYPHTDQPVVFALADYNAGRANVVRWLHGEARTNAQAFLEAMDFPSTRRYIRAVLAQHAAYRGDPPPSP